VILAGAGIDFLANKYLPVKAIAQFNHNLGKINLNSADKDTLMSVSGIGEKLAKRIIEYRDKHTSFSDIGELKDITGISESKYEKIKDYLIAE
jgi:competence ComEA-like helix-hairpin-helix protein